MRVISDMVLRADITIDADKLKEQPVLPEILDIIRVIRPKWEPNKISYKVTSLFVCNFINIRYNKCASM